MIAIPIARRFARAAIDDQILRPLGNFLVKIVHQHAHGRFLLPTFAGKRVAARGANAGVRRGGSFGINWHRNMVVRSGAESSMRGGFQFEVPIAGSLRSSFIRLVAMILRG